MANRRCADLALRSSPLFPKRFLSYAKKASASAPGHRSSRITAPDPRAATANQELSKRRPANDRSGSPSPAALIFRADLHIGARRVFDRFELAVAGLAGRDLAAGVSRYPPLPDRPPRIRALRRAGEPL